jgi:putative Holliday junction resolvase
LKTRTLGLDVGSRRIGVALEDELGITAQPLTVLNVDRDDTVGMIGDLCRKHQVGTVVVGLPLSMSGQDGGSSARRARALGVQLEQSLKVEVVFWDERFTTVQAEKLLKSANVKRANRKAVIDKMAAALILQGYLDAR